MSTRRSPSSGQAAGLPEELNRPDLSTRQARITPRNSDGDASFVAEVAKETPYGTLRQLANIPKPSTPLRRASSAGPPSHRSVRRTPTAQTRTPGAAQRYGGSARRPTALTPHGRAAMREVEARRAGLTPGKDRRRSGRQQKETPRDDLRMLSRLMAEKTKPVVPTPENPKFLSGRPTFAGHDDLDDGPDLVRPRLSLALDEDEDDSLLLPPQSAGLEDENFTVQSMELPRRAISEQPKRRLSRGSFGSIDPNDFTNLGGGIFDSSFAMGGAFDDSSMVMPEDAPGEHTAMLGPLDFERRRISLASGRDSDIRPEAIEDDTENTFVLTFPQQAGALEYGSGGSVTSPSARSVEDEDLDEIVPIHIEDLGPSYSQDDDELYASNQEPTTRDVNTPGTTKLKTNRNKKSKLSKHRIPYPSLPAGVVKKLAVQYARTGGNSKAAISKDTLAAISQASDWFLEQVSDDLGAYSEHAGRKTIDETDMITLMKRQRQTDATTTPFSLAQRFLPRELLQGMRMTPPSKSKNARYVQELKEIEE